MIAEKIGYFPALSKFSAYAIIELQFTVVRQQTGWQNQQWRITMVFLYDLDGTLINSQEGVICICDSAREVAAYIERHYD